jgi:hypothetical protein
LVSSQVPVLATISKHPLSQSTVVSSSATAITISTAPFSQSTAIPSSAIAIQTQTPKATARKLAMIYMYSEDEPMPTQTLQNFTNLYFNPGVINGKLRSGLNENFFRNSCNQFSFSGIHSDGADAVPQGHLSATQLD